MDIGQREMCFVETNDIVNNRKQTLTTKLCMIDDVQLPSIHFVKCKQHNYIVLLTVIQSLLQNSKTCNRNIAKYYHVYSHIWNNYRETILCLGQHFLKTWMTNPPTTERKKSYIFLFFLEMQFCWQLSQ